MQIRQNANRAANLVRQLLAYSRQQTLQPRVISLSEVLAELAHLLRRLIGGAYRAEAGAWPRPSIRCWSIQGQVEQVVDQSGGQCPRRHARGRNADHPHRRI